MGTGVRQQCTAADRKRICELQLAHKDLTQEKLTALIADQLKLPNIKRPTVTGILKESHKWLNSADTTADKRVRDRKPLHENLETVLMQWFGQLRARGALISDRLLVEKARELAQKLSIADFKASDGRLAKFKKRHNIKLQRPHGESGAADLEGVDVAQKVIPLIISELGYTLDTVYNMDETGLYYRAKPSKTLAQGVLAAACAS